MADNTVTVATYRDEDDGGVTETSVTYSSISEVSDGYHTFDELYRFRMLYNAALFNTWTANEEGVMYDVHKSWKHSDGEPAFGGGWFVVVAQLPTGQITNHYEAQYWDLFHIPTRAKAAPWDGHIAQDVATRLQTYLEHPDGLA